MLSLPPPNREIAQPSNTTIRIITIAIQPPATIAAINAFVPAMIALTAAMVALTVVLAAAADAFADALAACAAFCAVLAEAFAAACAVLVACCVVLMAALEVTCAVFTLLSVVFTEPFAAVLTVFPALLADCLIVLLVSVDVFMVWTEASETGERPAVPRWICKPFCPDTFLADLCSAALTARFCLKSAILSFALTTVSLVVLTPFCPCLLNWWIPSSFTRSEA